MRTLLALLTMAALGMGVVGCSETAPPKPAGPPPKIELGKGTKEAREEDKKAAEAKKEEPKVDEPKKEEPKAEEPKKE